MFKSGLVDSVVGILSDAGFSVVDCRGSRSSFDVIARRGSLLLLVKALSNIEGLGRDSASDLKGVSALLGAVPMVVAERMKSSRLDDGIVYDRYGVYVSNLSTLGGVVQDMSPGVYGTGVERPLLQGRDEGGSRVGTVQSAAGGIVYSTRGNYCVHINREVLCGARRRLGLTQDSLAELLGVSKQSVYRYERSGRVSLDVFGRLAGLFDDDLADREYKLTFQQDGETGSADRRVTLLKRRVCSEFRSMGFDAVMTTAPFDIVASRDERVFSAVSNDWRRLRDRLAVLEGISELVGGYAVCISDRKVKGETSVLSPEELAEIKTPRELFKLLSS